MTPQHRQMIAQRIHAVYQTARQLPAELDTNASAVEALVSDHLEGIEALAVAAFSVLVGRHPGSVRAADLLPHNL